MDGFGEMALQLVEYSMRTAKQPVATQDSLVLDTVELASDGSKRAIEFLLDQFVAGVDDRIQVL
jgi:hypothetical protein